MSKVRYLYIGSGGAGTYRGRDAETILAQSYTRYVGIVPIPKGTRKERMLFMYAALKKHTSKPGELMLVREPRRNKEKHSRYIQQLAKYGIAQAIRRPSRRAVARLAQARAARGAGAVPVPDGTLRSPTFRRVENVQILPEASWTVNLDGVPVAVTPPQTPTAWQFNPQATYREMEEATNAALRQQADQHVMRQAGEGILGRR